MLDYLTLLSSPVAGGEQKVNWVGVTPLLYTRAAQDTGAGPGGNQILGMGHGGLWGYTGPSIVVEGVSLAGAADGYHYWCTPETPGQ